MVGAGLLALIVCKLLLPQLWCPVVLYVFASSHPTFYCFHKVSPLSVLLQLAYHNHGLLFHSLHSTVAKVMPLHADKQVGVRTHTTLTEDSY